MQTAKSKVLLYGEWVECLQQPPPQVDVIGVPGVPRVK